MRVALFFDAHGRRREGRQDATGRRIFHQTPISGWNGSFQAVGNGSWGGTLGYPAMGKALADEYVTSSTDTGHTGPSAAFALGHPEKLIDYAYRSEHVMTIEAEAVIDAFYGVRAKFSYWNGCSTGGRQALMEAARFPDDYDGIIAGAEANPKTHLDAWRIWMVQAMFKNAASVIPVSKFALIHRAVLNACDATDGLADGLIDDPRACRFDPQTLLCRDGDGPECLTAEQVATARIIMSPDGPFGPGFLGHGLDENRRPYLRRTNAW